MKELDLLKKHWNENHNFPKISVAEMHTMIRKKSSSIVLWIFGISVAEFILLNALSYLFLGSANDSNSLNNTSALKDSVVFVFMVENIDYLSGFISVLFILLFYRNYKKIYVAASTTALMKQIIKTKKTVNYYIYSNFAIFIIAFIAILINLIYHNIDRELTLRVYLITIVVLLLVCAVFLCIIWLYYKLVYGLLINKLMKNYKELEKIDYE